MNDSSDKAFPASTAFHRPDRRRFLAGLAGALCAPGLFTPSLARAREMPRRLAFLHTHTGEKLSIVYAENGSYVPEALTAINHLLRDFRTGEIHAIDLALLDQLTDLTAILGANRTYEVICGYRCPATNAMLRENGHGVAKASLHMSGRAIDVRLPGVALTMLRDAALSMSAGGVGYYSQSDFVHLDTGRVRRW
ncbi:MAG TPA: DUF882 domain-containing protein [Gammaproteobacteria bacterium]|nr:DUF882 domain-containing protein [Gammaproteobacteria bacterium]